MTIPRDEAGIVSGNDYKHETYYTKIIINNKICRPDLKYTDSQMSNISVNIIMESPATYLCTLAIINIYIVNVANYMPITT